LRLNLMAGRPKGGEGREEITAKPETCVLCELSQGESATITEIARAYPHPELLEGYGIAAGVRVVRERTAPQGDPIIFHVEGRLVALRREDAMHVLVRREGPK